MGPIAIAGGMLAGSLINNAANIWSTSGSNKKNREWSEYMYNKQYQDTLDFYNMQKQDNIDFWNMQNEYNSPEAQVERMRAAGLNPDFQGIQSNPAGSISAPSMSTPTPMGVTHQRMPVMLDNIVADIFSAIQMYQGLQSNSLDLQGKQTDIYNKLALDWMDKSGIDPTKPETFYDKDGNVNVYVADTSRYNYLSRKQKRDFADFSNRYVKSLRAKYSYLGDVNKYENELKSWRERNADPLFSASFDLGDNILKFAHIMRDAEYQSYKASRSQSMYNQTYFDNLEPSTAAAAENISNEHKKFQEKLMRDITKELDKHISNKDWFNAWFWLKLRTSIQTGQTGLSKFGSALGSAAGSAFGGPAGAAIGGALGGLL